MNAKREEELRYWNSFSVHVWYEPLKDLTFPSSFLSVSVEEAQACVAYQERLLASLTTDADHSASAAPDAEDIPDYDDCPLLMGLEQRMNPIIEQYVKEGGGAFVKLSDRSPKDAATERGRIYNFLQLPGQEVGGRGATDLSSNAIGLPAVYRAMMGALKIKSGREALKLLLISFRTLEDVQIRLDYREKLWELKLVIRQWVDFDIAYELRGFVCDNRLTALSQYYYDCYFDVVAQQKELIAKSVQHYWENQVKGKPPYDSYVIDFTVLPHADLAEGELLPVTIVELNPFDEYTDSALFNWKLHRQTLHEGPFAFKIVEHPSIEPKRTWWKRILINHVERIKNSTDKADAGAGAGEEGSEKKQKGEKNKKKKEKKKEKKTARKKEKKSKHRADENKGEETENTQQ